MKRALLIPFVAAGMAALFSIPAPSPLVPGFVPEARAWLPAEPLADPKFEEILQLENTRDTGDRLKALARDASPLVRARALRALARAQLAELKPLFISSLDDKEPAVRHEAAMALGLLWDQGDAGALMAAAGREKDVRVLDALIEAVGRCAVDSTGVQFLAARAGLPDTAVAARACLALGVAGYRKIPTGSALPQLIDASRSRAASVRWAAAYAMFRGPNAEATIAVRPLLKDRDSRVRIYAIRTIVAAKRTNLAEAVSSLARDPEWTVRVEALKALAPLRGGLFFSLAGLGVDDPNPLVQLTAVEALGDLHVDQGLTYLQRILNESEDLVLRGAAIVAKTKIQQDGALPDLRTWKKSSEPAIRRACAQAFGELRSDQARSLLAEMINDEDPRVLAEVVSALGNYPQIYALGDLQATLKSDDIAVLTNAASALGERRDRTAIEPLSDVFHRLRSPSDVEPMVEIMKALGKIASPTDTARAYGLLSPELSRAAVATLRDGLKDTELNVARAAAEGLRAIDGKDHSAEIVSATAAPFPLYLDEIRALTARQVRLTTRRGEIVFDLLPGAAPNTVANFVKLAASGYFDGLRFHRVVPGFVTQDGDPRGDGWGGPGYAIRCEYNDLHYETGMVGMALSGKDTGGSQYFITHTPQPHLDGKYTIFGRVTRGMDAIARLARGDKIEKVELLP